MSISPDIPPEIAFIHCLVVHKLIDLVNYEALDDIEGQ